MTAPPIPRDRAAAIYDILVATVGASEYWRADFLQAQAEGCQEYRFSGMLGFGGKFWHAEVREPPYYVTCYPEDETPARRRAMAKANASLHSMWVEWRRGEET